MNDEKRWPEATNYEEAARLRNAYQHALGMLNREGYPTTVNGWHECFYAQRNAEALLSLAQMHATLALADEVRAAHGKMRLR